MAAPAENDREWRHHTATTEWLISTKFDYLDFEFINDAFGTDDMYWAKSLPTDLLSATLSSSLTLGLYKLMPATAEAKNADSPSSPRTPSPTLEDIPRERLQQVGMARFITDRVTTAYLTDVYVHPDFRREGLGKWLVACCNDVIESMPAMRRVFLAASLEVGKPYYSKTLGFHDIEEERTNGLVIMTKRGFKLGHD